MPTKIQKCRGGCGALTTRRCGRCYACEFAAAVQEATAATLRREREAFEGLRARLAGAVR